MRRFEEGTVLICEECGERIVLAGPEEVWRPEPAVFGCQCEERLTLEDRAQDSSLSKRITGASATT